MNYRVTVICDRVSCVWCSNTNSFICVHFPPPVLPVSHVLCNLSLWQAIFYFSFFLFSPNLSTVVLAAASNGIFSQAGLFFPWPQNQLFNMLSRAYTWLFLEIGETDHSEKASYWQESRFFSWDDLLFSREECRRRWTCAFRVCQRRAAKLWLFVGCPSIAGSSAPAFTFCFRQPSVCKQRLF